MNTFVGHNAGRDNAGGVQNVIIGKDAGKKAQQQVKIP